MVSVLPDSEDWGTFAVKVDKIMSMALDLQSFLLLFEEMLRELKVTEGPNAFLPSFIFLFGYFKHF